MKQNRQLLYLIAFLFTAAHGISGAEPLVTDRPDATESSSVIAPSFAQFEIGITSGEDPAGESFTDFGGSLLRVGMIEDWELRLGWDGYHEGAGISGAGDGLLGFKYYIAPEKREDFLPEMALLVHTTAPWGDNDLSSDEWDPSFLFAFSHTLNDRWSLGYNVGAELATNEKANGDDTTLSSALYSVALGYGATDQLGLYIEVFGDVGLSADDSSASLDGGFTWLFNDDNQLDVFAGVGLDEDADDWFVGIGYSVRFGY
jgi:hypothetical protein